MDNDRVTDRREQIATVFPFPAKPIEEPAPDFVGVAADMVIRDALDRIAIECRASLTGKSADYLDGYIAAMRELCSATMAEHYNRITGGR